MKTFATLALIGCATALRLKEEGPGPQGPPAGGDEISPEQFIEACKFLHDNQDADPEDAAAWAQENLGFVPTEEQVAEFAGECILAAAEAGAYDEDGEGSDSGIDTEDFVEACGALAEAKEAGLGDDEILAAARELSGEPELTGEELAAFGDLCLAAWEAAGEPEEGDLAQIKEGEGDDEEGEPDSSDIEDFVEACYRLHEADEAGATWEDIAAGVLEETGEEVGEDDINALRGACQEAAEALENADSDSDSDDDGEGDDDEDSSDLDTSDFEELCEAIWETKDWDFADIQAAFAEEHDGDVLEEDDYLGMAAACEAAYEAAEGDDDGDDE